MCLGCHCSHVVKLKSLPDGDEVPGTAGAGTELEPEGLCADMPEGLD